MNTLQAEPPICLYERGAGVLVEEMMFYQYLPVAMRECDTGVPFSRGRRLEPRLARLPGLTHMLEEAWDCAPLFVPGFDPKTYYCYLTIKRGWATTESPLNRPGWHVDAWGHPEDITFLWSDRYSTRYITGPVRGDLSTDAKALQAFEAAGRRAEDCGEVQYAPPGGLYVFNQTCVHATPVIPEGGGMRTFVKVNLSPHRYNLAGNSINHELVYDWQMYDRTELRNHPERLDSNADYVSEGTS